MTKKEIRRERVKVFLLGMITALAFIFLIGADEGGIPGVEMQGPAAGEGIGRYQISSTSTVMTSGLPWFAVWVVDTKTGEVKWVDHPNVPESQQQYGIPFGEMTHKPLKGK